MRAEGMMIGTFAPFHYDLDVDSEEGYVRLRITKVYEKRERRVTIISVYLVEDEVKRLIEAFRKEVK